jgi:hypothetical protein
MSIKDWDNPDRFEREVIGWIQQERKHAEVDLERLEYNVIDVYRRLIRFPAVCPGCFRSGNDHDMECALPDWTGPDHGLVNG